MKSHVEIWTISMNRKILFLPEKDTFRAIAKLVVLKKSKMRDRYSG